MSVTAAELDAYWTSVRNRDEQAAYDVVAACRARGLPVSVVLDGLVSAAQSRVGELWATDELSVAQEHAATSVSESVVTRLAQDLPTPTGPLVLVACAEREWHALPALVVTQTLRDLGVRAEFVGASVSAEQLVARVLDTGPRAVLLSASVTSSLARVRRQVEAVRSTGTPVIVGGRAFGGDPARAEHLGATAYAGRPAEVLALLGTLPHHVTAAAPLRGEAAQEARAIASARDDIVREVLEAPAVAAALGEGDGSPDQWTTVLATFVPHVVDCVVGSLLAEDASILEAERGWLEFVVSRRGGEPASVDAVWAALAEQLREFPEAARTLS